MNKSYNRINWENYPSDKTPLNDQNLNKIDASVDEQDNRIISLDTRKFDKSEAQLLIKNITFDLQTGILTKYYYNGSTEEINTGISKLNMNLRFDKESQILYIVNADGTEDPIDLSVFITNYEFRDSDTIAHNVSSDGTVTSIVKDGSITEDKLQPNYLADIKVEVAKAEASVTAAGNSETAAKESETNAKQSEDNAKASETAAADSASDSADSATAAAGSATSAAVSAATATQKAEDAGDSATDAATSATNAANSASTATTKANAASASATAAAASATSADTYAKKSQSYAVGGTGTREGEDSDNAQYYYEQAKSEADRAKSEADRAGEIANIGLATTEKAGLVKPDGKTITVSEDGTITGASTEFTGTTEEYEAAYAAGEIDDGTIVNITDDYQEGGGGSEVFVDGTTIVKDLQTDVISVAPSLVGKINSAAQGDGLTFSVTENNILRVSWEEGT